MAVLKVFDAFLQVNIINKQLISYEKAPLVSI